MDVESESEGREMDEKNDVTALKTGDFEDEGCCEDAVCAHVSELKGEW